MFWLGFGAGVYTIAIGEFIALVIYAIKGGRKKVNFDDMTKEEYDMYILLKGKSRMEQDEILGNLEKR
jgi:hypothetical protein